MLNHENIKVVNLVNQSQVPGFGVDGVDRILVRVEGDELGGIVHAGSDSKAGLIRQRLTQNPKTNPL